MSSHLRYSTTPSATASPTPNIRRPSIASPPPKKQKMSITQTYMLASVARRQLQKEAARADHDLRLLVGHANLLDGLMLDLANAEQEQESWFNQSVSTANKAESSSGSKHVQWAENHSIPEEAVDDEYDEDEDAVYEEDSDDESTTVVPAIPQRSARPSIPQVTTTAIDADEETDDEADDDDQEMDDDFSEELTLTRSPSHSASSPPSSSSPPELLLEDSEDSEESDDDSMPASPPQPNFPSFESLSPKSANGLLTVGGSRTTVVSKPQDGNLSLFDHESQQAIPIVAVC